MEVRRAAALLCAALSLTAPTALPIRGQSPADPFARCEEGFAADPGDPQSARCFFEVAKRGGLWDEAARKLSSRRADHRENPWLPLYLGHVHLYRGSKEAEEMYRDAMSIAEIHGEPLAAIEVRIALARYLSRLGQPEAAGEVLSVAIEIAEETADPILLAKVRIRQAWQYYYQGRRLDHARHLLQRVEEDVFRKGPQDLQRAWLDCMAVVSYALGRNDVYLRCKERLLAIAQEAGDLAAEAAARFDIANQHSVAELPNPKARQVGRDLFEAALAAAEAAQHPSIAGHAHRELGNLLGGEAGRQHLEACLKIAQELDDQRLLNLCRGALAANWLEEDPRRSQELIERALAAAVTSADPWILVFLWEERLRIYWSTLPRHEAINRSLEVLDAIEALREKQDPGAGRAGLLSAQAEAYYWLSGRLLRDEPPASDPRQDLKLALNITERLRAQVLLETLEAARAADTVLRDPPLATLDQLENRLEDKEALLSYQFGLDENFSGRFAGGSWLLVSTRGSTKSYRLADRVAVEPALDVLLSMPRLEDAAKALDRLYRDLLQQALDDLPPGIEWLSIIPDGELHRLPFALLGSEDAEPLIARYRLSVAPSATLWLRWRTLDPPTNKAPALVFADPVLEGREADDQPSALLPPLPYARKEGRTVVEILGEESRLLAGEEATERFLKEHDLRRYGVLHFATHAVINREVPERSAVMLAPGAADEDGWLQPREIVDLDLDGRVVVLASCDSAAGQVLRGEGVMSLARAFFQAGAPVVVAGLWPLPDDKTAAIFKEFYRHLADGSSVAAALASAQREMIRKGTPARAWAGLVVLGNGDLVPFPGGLERPLFRWWIAGVLLVLLALLGLLLRRRAA